jgi:lysophospholipase
MIRRTLLAALILTLCACGARGARDPFTDSRIPPSLGPAFWPPPGWAWGLIQTPGAPAQRYGVAAPTDEPPIAQALMLPGYGGLAEEDFQAAGQLIDRRIQVWTLDGVGQGGSGRIALPRDLGHVDSFDADVAGLDQMVAAVIRPAPGAPLVAIADGAAAPVLLRALQTGPGRIAAVVLTDPRLSTPGHHTPRRPRSPEAAQWARRLGIGRRRAPDQGGWRRDAPTAPFGSPAFVRHAWQLANPDLRMGGPSLGWQAAFDDLLAGLRADGWARVRAPVLVLADPAAPTAERQAQAALCRALPRCIFALAAPDQWPQREAAFIETLVAAAENPLETHALPIAGRGR